MLSSASSIESSCLILFSKLLILRYSFFNCTEKTLLPESSVPGPWLGRPSNRAEDAEEPSVVEDKVKAEDEIDAAYDDVDDAET